MPEVKIKIGDKTFKTTRNGKELIISGAIINKLTKKFFIQLGDLENLYIAHSKINTIEKGAFDKLTKLKLLMLRNSNIKELPEGLFDKLSSLDYLILDENKLESLPHGIFDRLTKLTKLTLQTSSKVLQEGIFDKLTKLSFLSLRSTKLNEDDAPLSKNLLDKLTKLRTVHISFQSGNPLPTGFFDKLVNIRVMQMPFSPTTFVDSPNEILNKLNPTYRKQVLDYRKQINALKNVMGGRNKIFDTENPLTTPWMQLCLNGDKDGLIEHLRTRVGDFDVEKLRELSIAQICKLLSDNLASKRDAVDHDWVKRCEVQYDSDEDEADDLFMMPLRDLYPDVYFVEQGGVTYCFSSRDIVGILNDQEPNNPFNRNKFTNAEVADMRNWLNNSIHRFIEKDRVLVLNAETMVTNLLAKINAVYPHVQMEMIMNASNNALKELPIRMRQTNPGMYFNQLLLDELNNEFEKKDVIIKFVKLMDNIIEHYENEGDSSGIRANIGQYISMI